MVNHPHSTSTPRLVCATTEIAARATVARNRGTAMVLALLLTLLLTTLVLAVTMTGGVQAQNAGMSVHTDQANAVAESIGQQAMWQFKTNNAWRQLTLPSPLPTLTMGNNTFSYAMTCVDAGATATLYWPLSEGTGTTTADISGNNNTGTLIGGVSWTTGGRYGDALAFDGISGYVDAGNAPSTNIVGSCTMAAWVKMNSAAQDQKVGGNQDGTSGGYKMSIYGLREEFEVRDASNNPWLDRAVSGGTILTMGVWYHCAGVFDSSAGTIKTYINGVLDRELGGVPSNALATTTGDFQMGREPWNTGGANRYFNGTLDEIRVYNRALSAAEIRALADTSVHVHAVATLKTPAVVNPPTNTVDFIMSSPTPAAPIAPALTIGGSWSVALATVSGNVQVDGSVTGVSTSTVNGLFNYGGAYSDTNHKITITYQGKSGTAAQTNGLTVPTINYANIQSQAVQTATGGTGQYFGFTYQQGSANVIYVNGNVTNPTIDTSQTGGTILINGNLTISNASTFGSAGFPAYIVVEGNVTQTANVTIYGALYVKGTWNHVDTSVYGDVVVGGSVGDNSTTGSTYIVGAIPWFDPRSSTAPTVQPIYYTDYEGAAP
jgi:hypothetical protein